MGLRVSKVLFWSFSHNIGFQDSSFIRVLCHGLVLSKLPKRLNFPFVVFTALGLGAV